MSENEKGRDLVDAQGEPITHRASEEQAERGDVPAEPESQTDPGPVDNKFADTPDDPADGSEVRSAVMGGGNPNWPDEPRTPADFRERAAARARLEEAVKEAEEDLDFAKADLEEFDAVVEEDDDMGVSADDSFPPFAAGQEESDDSDGVSVA